MTSRAKRAWYFISDMLAAEKAPYLVAAFIAAAAWTIVRTTDRLGALPLTEYQLRSDSESGRLQTTDIRLRNITTSGKFPCFGIAIASAGEPTISFDPTASHSVVIRGGVLSRVSKTAIEKEIATFTITDFAPGADVEIKLPTIGSGRPRLVVAACGGANRTEQPALPLLIERSAQSFLVEHELGVLWAGLAIWLALILVMFLAQQRHRRGIQ